MQLIAPLWRLVITIGLFLGLSGLALGQQGNSTGGIGVPLPFSGPAVDRSLEPIDQTPIRMLPESSPTMELSPKVLQELSAFWKGMISDYRLPGAAIAIVQPDGVVFELCVGQRAIDQDGEINADTLFNLGPATLALTTLLGATADRPDNLIFDRRATTVTTLFRMTDRRAQETCRIRDLLTMTAGLPPYTDEILDPQWARPEDVFALVGQAPVMSPPGQRYRPSEVSATVGGYLTAMAVGNRNRGLYANFTDTMEERILKPIGMSKATFSSRTAQETGNFARPHRAAQFSYDPIFVEANERNPMAPLLGLKISLNDAARWIQTELNQGITPGGERIAQAISVRERWMPAPTRSSAHIGMGWQREYYDETEIIGASGTEGQHAAAVGLFPSYRTGYVVLTNAASEDAMRLLEAVKLALAEAVEESRNTDAPRSIASE